MYTALTTEKKEKVIQMAQQQTTATEVEERIILMAQKQKTNNPKQTQNMKDFTVRYSKTCVQYSTVL